MTRNQLNTLARLIYESGWVTGAERALKATTETVFETVMKEDFALFAPKYVESLGIANGALDLEKQSHCSRCGQPIDFDKGTWVDLTGGDTCGDYDSHRAI